ncbi:MAG: M28 family peptidase [Bacteroidota bacterium]
MNQIKIYFLLLLITGSILTCKNDPAGPSTSTTTTVEVPTMPRFNRDSAYAFIEKQVSFGSRIPGSESHQACKEWIVAKMESFGTVVTQQDFEATIYDGQTLPGTNIFAQINPQSTQRLLFGAHWDSRIIADSPLSTERQDEPILGADDGASGVGVLMEVARIIAQDTSLDIGIDIIFFDLEDNGDGSADNSGLPNTWALGAQHWSRNLPYSSVKPEYGILLDMVGSKGARFPKEGNSMRYAPQIVNKVWKLAGYLGYSNYFVDQPGRDITDDHLYVNTIARIPMIDVINLPTNTKTGFGEYWHTHNDNMEVIDKATIRTVGRLMVEVIYREDAGLL